MVEFHNLMYTVYSPNHLFPFCHSDRPKTSMMWRFSLTRKLLTLLLGGGEKGMLKHLAKRSL